MSDVFGFCVFASAAEAEAEAFFPPRRRARVLRGMIYISLPF
jgi:hypothetical protein